MEKAGIVVGGSLGASIVLVLFAIAFVPPPDMSVPDITVTNGDTVQKFNKSVPVVKSSKAKTSLVHIFENSEAGVVRVNVQKDNELRSNGVGSGFVFDNKGHIITNAHVVDGSKSIVVTFLDGRQYNAELIGADIFTDIAVIKVNEARSRLHPLPMGDSSMLKVGEQIAAIGNPFGLSGSMTSGIVSQLGRLLPSQETGFSIPNVIQTDAAINPGNSGGPLLNMKGQVVGINTAIQSATGEFTGVGFAVPSNTLSKIVPRLIEDGDYKHPWIGISGRDIDPNLANILGLQDARGFLIVNVIEGSPAAKAGLHGSDEVRRINGIEYPVGGDIILAVDGKEVRKIDDILIHLQREKSVGDEMVLQILREGRITNVTVVLEERPPV